MKKFLLPIAILAVYIAGKASLFGSEFSRQYTPVTAFIFIVVTIWIIYKEYKNLSKINTTNTPAGKKLLRTYTLYTFLIGIGLVVIFGWFERSTIKDSFGISSEEVAGNPDDTKGDSTTTATKDTTTISSKEKIVGMAKVFNNPFYFVKVARCFYMDYKKNNPSPTEPAAPQQYVFGKNEPIDTAKLFAGNASVQNAKHIRDSLLRVKLVNDEVERINKESIALNTDISKTCPCPPVLKNGCNKLQPKTDITANSAPKQRRRNIGDYCSNDRLPKGYKRIEY